jgi:hypothetical protein
VLRRKGKINEIIYNNTAFYEKGRYIQYPTIDYLNNLLDEIISAKSTTKYIRINPFYYNETAKQHIEFDEFMFYIECREWFDEKILEKHIKENLDFQSLHIKTDDIKIGKILYPLCKTNDIVSFNNALEKYKELLQQLLPRMFDIAKQEMDLEEKDLAFGYFCFEVHSE